MENNFTTLANDHVESYISKLPNGVGPLAGFLTIILMIVGIIGNILTVLAIFKSPKLRNAASVFVVSLSIGDILYASIILPLQTSVFINGHFNPGEPMCSLTTFIGYGIGIVVVMFVALITINRYFMICHHNLYARVYTTKNMGAMIVFCCLLTFGMQIPIIMGKWGRYGYDHSIGSCSIIEDENHKSSVSMITSSATMIPSLIIIFCYARIYWVVYKSGKRLRKHSSCNEGPGNSRTMTKNEWRVTKMTLAVFISFVLCYIPYSLVKALKNVGKVDPVLEALSNICAFCSVSINPIIYVVMNKQYREAYFMVLTSCQSYLPRIRRQSSQCERSFSSRNSRSSKSTQLISIEMVPLK